MKRKTGILKEYDVMQELDQLKKKGMPADGIAKVLLVNDAPGEPNYVQWAWVERKDMEAYKGKSKSQITAHFKKMCI